MSSGTYGLEFSPNSALLYIGGPSSIDQFAIANYIDSASLEATRINITPASGVIRRGMQTGPDGKIYIAVSNQSYLSRIDVPNERGTQCHFIENAIDLQGRTALLGLPGFVPLRRKEFQLGIKATIIDVCKRDIQFDAINNLTTHTDYKWYFGDGDSSNMEAPPKNYGNQENSFTVTLIGTTQTGSMIQTKTVTKTITFNPLPQANAGNDMIAIAGAPIHLTGSGGVTYLWSPSQYLNHSTIADPIAALSKDQTFTLKVANADGCMDEDQVSVKVYKEATIYVPTGFTPNNDSKNDALHAVPAGVKLESFSVYNRWGNRVFSTTDDIKGWNGLYKGKKQPEGTYVWIATGVDFKGQAVLRRGTVNLVR